MPADEPPFISDAYGPGWCKHCDATVTVAFVIDRDAWVCKLGHVTTGIDWVEHESADG